jgi:hypothetical protein
MYARDLRRASMRWAYGVMTCKERATNILSKTLTSLATGGFDKPRIFLDDGWEEIPIAIELDFTNRSPRINPFGNWLLGIWELYIRNPNAERYAMFQDDIVCYKNLRQYLEQCNLLQYQPMTESTRTDTIQEPNKRYWNLFTFTATVDVAKHQPSNEELAPKDRTGWYESNQLGRGAVALVFDRQGLQTLLSSPLLVQHPMEVYLGTRRIDGIVRDCLSAAGYVEYVHWPSLVQHVGDLSTIGNPTQKPAISFRGEEYDALNLLKRETV